MDNKSLLDIYNSVSEEQHNEYEAMYELLTMDVNIENSKLKEALSYFIIKTYLLENNFI